ncbi:hypothetical protein ZIOFF_010843 [Zingiber officinale]|uniref:Exocyst complex component Sec8 n=1 Tax=Zingiber officinale TaxID=94328 RepID=A0A8J5HMK8_ZINOF|nr:hypothetical protein ZIOFF_010843 [Zingiber officinale]
MIRACSTHCLNGLTDPSRMMASRRRSHPPARWRRHVMNIGSLLHSSAFAAPCADLSASSFLPTLIVGLNLDLPFSAGRSRGPSISLHNAAIVIRIPRIRLQGYASRTTAGWIALGFFDGMFGMICPGFNRLATMSSGRAKGIFDGSPIPADKEMAFNNIVSYCGRGDDDHAIDSLPHVVHMLTSKDHEGEVQFLKEQRDLVEDVVDEVILRLFSESAKSISVDMADAKKLLGSHNKQLHQLWYHSLSLRHALALLDQIESVSKVPAEIEKLILDKQFYAAVQLQVQTMLVLERGLQVNQKWNGWVSGKGWLEPGVPAVGVATRRCSDERSKLGFGFPPLGQEPSRAEAMTQKGYG